MKIIKRGDGMKIEDEIFYTTISILIVTIIPPSIFYILSPASIATIIFSFVWAFGSSIIIAASMGNNSEDVGPR